MRLGTLCLLLTALGFACTGQMPDMPVNQGSMTLALAATGPDGQTYLLRNGSITIDGPTTAVIETESDLTATVRSITAAAGNYTVSLAEGWSINRVDPMLGNVAVDASLVSANPQMVHVSPATTTTVRLRFTVAGIGDVVLDPGQLDVAIEIAPAACQPAPQGGCATGRKCTDFMGNSRCAPDGIVPEGGACTSADGVDDCAAGTLCRDGVCTRICELGSSECSCVRFSGFFDDNETIGLCVPSCDPVGQDCPAGQGCYLASEPLAMCADAGMVPVGGSCEFVNSCEPGASCVFQYPDRTEPECIAHCNVGSTSCGPDAVCVQVSDQSATIGVCIDCLRAPEFCQ
jgi:hypothetical protein